MCKLGVNVIWILGFEPDRHRIFLDPMVFKNQDFPDPVVLEISVSTRNCLMLLDFSTEVI